MTQSYVDHNHDLWNQWTHLHVETESDYQKEIDRFKAGESTLDPLIMEEVGTVAGKKLLHLMCHLGLDTLSWAKLGALATGVDFSQESISQARQFSAVSGIPAEFICADVYALPKRLNGQFDIVYTEGGVLAWLPDLYRWAQVVALCLKPGGRFYIRDSHPFRRVLFPIAIDVHGQPAYYRYFSPEPTKIEMRGSYAQPNADTLYTAYFWVHGIGEIVTALCSAGLRIEFLHEFPKVYDALPTSLRTALGQFETLVLHDWAIPNTFSLRASLPMRRE